jgi:hypothetical protein
MTHSTRRARSLAFGGVGAERQIREAGLRSWRSSASYSPQVRDEIEKCILGLDSVKPILACK